ncbi:MAG: hypothetical protein JO119_11690, partial [Acidobacteria bacterium]|nr:hypothetical protein [Acidobacteriota bacterium]
MKIGLKVVRGSLLFVVATAVICGCSSKPDADKPASASSQPAAADANSSSAKPAAETPKPEPPAAGPSGAPASTTAVSPTPEAARPFGPIQFTDVTAAAGIHFKHDSGAFGKKYLPETMGSGVCFIDYDNDGWQDI